MRIERWLPASFLIGFIASRYFYIPLDHNPSTSIIPFAVHLHHWSWASPTAVAILVSERIKYPWLKTIFRLISLAIVSTITILHMCFTDNYARMPELFWILLSFESLALGIFLSSKEEVKKNMSSLIFWITSGIAAEGCLFVLIEIFKDSNYSGLKFFLK